MNSLLFQRGDNMNLSLFQPRNVISAFGKALSQDLLKEITSYMERLDLSKYTEKDRFTFDRVEGDFAICENRANGNMIEVPKDLLDGSSEVGSILRIQDGKFVPCLEETQNAREHIQSLVDDLFS